MTHKSLNRVLAEVLDRLMRERGLDNSALGRRAGVAANTVANYRRTDAPTFTSRGKERSAKLAEVERIADALGVHPLFLLTDPAEQAERAAAIARAITMAPSTTAEGAPRKRATLAA